MNASQTYRRVVLVTGATTGIGLALVRSLQREDYIIIATGRLSSLARFSSDSIFESEKLLIRPLDVRVADDVEPLFREIEQRFGGVDILVNNAGISYRAVQEHLSCADEQEQFDVNYFGPMRLIRRALPPMRRKRFGRIVNISSVGGMMAMPTMSVYSASKFALEGASEGLWYELRPWNISVSLVQPGFVNSNGFERVRMTPEGRDSFCDSEKAYHSHYEHMSRFIEQRMRKARATPDSVARCIIRTIQHPDPPLRVPATIDARLFAILRRILPRGLYHRLLFRCLPAIQEWGPGKTEITESPVSSIRARRTRTVVE